MRLRDMNWSVYYGIAFETVEPSVVIFAFSASMVLWTSREYVVAL
jgi:hypothetical protein